MITALRRWLWRLRAFFYFSPAASTAALACLFVFLIQHTTSQVAFAYGYSFGQVIDACFGLNWPLLKIGFFWQPVTYLFLHASWWHLTFNGVTLALFGSGVEREIGSGRFWLLFLLGGVLAGAGWLAVSHALSFVPDFDLIPAVWRERLKLGPAIHPSAQGLLIGASGGVFALIAAYAALFPRRELYVLLVVFPLKLRACTLVWLLIAMDVVSAVVVQGRIAYAAHLSGCLAGYLYGCYLRRRGVAANKWTQWRDREFENHEFQ